MSEFFLIIDWKLNAEILNELRRKLRNIREDLTNVKVDFNNQREDILNSIVISLPALGTLDGKTEKGALENEMALSKRIDQMTDNIGDLENRNNDLKTINQNLLDQLNGKPLSEMSNQKLDEMEAKLIALQMENDNLRRVNQNQVAESTDAHSNSVQMPERREEIQIQGENEASRKSSNQSPKQKLDEMAAEIDKLQKEKEELRTTNEKLLQQNVDDHSKNQDLNNATNDSNLERGSMVASEDILNQVSTNDRSFRPDWSTADLKIQQNENENLKHENENLVADIERLKNSENLVQLNVLQMEKDLKELSATNEILLAQLNQNSSVKGNQFSKINEQNLDGKAPPDTNDLLLINEELKKANENLSAQIRELKSTKNHSHLNAIENSSSDSILAQDGHQLLGNGHNLESDWMAVDMKKLQNKNEKLKMANENLETKIGELKSSENRAQMNVLQMEADMKELSAVNDSLLAQLNDRKVKDKHFSKIIDHDWMAQSAENLLKKNEELGNANENLSVENRKLKSTSLDRKSLSSSDSRLAQEKQQQQQLFSNNRNLESDWMVVDMKKLQNKNENLKSANDKLLAEVNELQRNLKSTENRLLLKAPEVKKYLEKSSPTDDCNSVHEKHQHRISSKDSNLESVQGHEQQLSGSDNNFESDWMAADIKKLKNRNDKLKMANENLETKVGELKTSENRSQVNILQLEKGLEKLSATNESLLAQLNEKELNDSKTRMSDGKAPDVKNLFEKNEKLKNANEFLSAQICDLETNTIQLQNENESLRAEISKLRKLNENDSEKLPSADQGPLALDADDLKNLHDQNEKLKMTNENLVSEIGDLKNSENLSRVAIKKMEKDLEQGSLVLGDDLKKLHDQNEKLKTTNENLVSEIGDLKNSGNLSQVTIMKMEKDLQQLSAINEILVGQLNDGLAPDVKDLLKKNEELSNLKESLSAEIYDLRKAETIARMESLQLKNELEKLSSESKMEFDVMAPDMKDLIKSNEELRHVKESLSAEICDLKEKEKNARLEAFELKNELEKLSTDSKMKFDEMAPDIKDSIKKNEELSNANENLSAEIMELKRTESRASLYATETKNELEKLYSSNESLRTQISELKKQSTNSRKSDVEGMAADMRKILIRNKKLNTANENLLSEINELRRELKTAENRHLTSVENEKELETLRAQNQSLLAQINDQKYDKKFSSKNLDMRIDAPDVKKLQKKNEELRAANEKLLAVVVNLKSSEKLAKSKSVEFEKELKKLSATNKSLQDTVENFVEKDPNNKKLKTELERLCQVILDKGVGSLTEIELNYLHKWFHKSIADEVDLKSARTKTASKKHCKICHNGVLDSWNKICECKQLEGMFVFCILFCICYNGIDFYANRVRRPIVKFL